LQYYSEESEFVGKIVSEITLKDLKELNASNYKIGCLEWKGEDAKKLLELYLEVGKQSNKLNMEQIALAEAKMIVNDLLTNEKRKRQYEKWNDIIEWKDEKYLLPVLQNDTLLYSLEDTFDDEVLDIELETKSIIPEPAEAPDTSRMEEINAFLSKQ